MLCVQREIIPLCKLPQKIATTTILPIAKRVGRQGLSKLYAQPYEVIFLGVPAYHIKVDHLSNLTFEIANHIMARNCTLLHHVVYRQHEFIS